MLIREYQEHDLDALHAIHAAQGFDYPLPDLRNPLFLTKLILTDDAANICSDSSSGDPGSQQILGAAFLRLTAEAYLLLDPKAGSPRQRWQSLLALHEAARRDAWHRGLEDVHAWLPPPIAHKFGSHIERLGWVRDDAWRPYCKEILSSK
jgi:hypothetical protein